MPTPPTALPLLARAIAYALRRSTLTNETRGEPKGERDESCQYEKYFREMWELFARSDVSESPPDKTSYEWYPCIYGY